MNPHTELWYLFGFTIKAITALSVFEGFISSSNPQRVSSQLLFNNEQSDGLSFNRDQMFMLRLWYRSDKMISMMFQKKTTVSYTSIWNSIISSILLGVLISQGFSITDKLSNNSIEILWLMITTKFTVNVLINLKLSFGLQYPFRIIFRLPIMIVRNCNGSKQNIILDIIGINMILIIVNIFGLFLGKLANIMTLKQVKLVIPRVDSIRSDVSYDSLNDVSDHDLEEIKVQSPMHSP